MAFDFSVTGNTKLDTSGFTQGVSSMTVAAGTLIADLVKTASSQLTNLAQSAIRNGSVYETSLAKVGTIADLGKLSIQKLGSQITDTSNTMGIAATDIAEATYQAISAGQDTANAVEFAGQAAKLATAGFTSTTSAVDILTTALNAYGLSADQATHVSDVLLTTQNLGKTSVDELSSSMGRVIPLAAAYNVSVENLSSGLAVMTANGIATAEATTYTKSMLNELGDTGSSVGKILQQQTGKSFAQLSAVLTARAWAMCCKCCMTAWAMMALPLPVCGPAWKLARVPFPWCPAARINSTACWPRWWTVPERPTPPTRP